MFSPRLFTYGVNYQVFETITQRGHLFWQEQIGFNRSSDMSGFVITKFISTFEIYCCATSLLLAWVDLQQAVLLWNLEPGLPAACIRVGDLLLLGVLGHMLVPRLS